MKSVDIKGKQYVCVNERLKHFREHYPEHSLVSEILSHEDGAIIIMASVRFRGKTLATGLAREKDGDSYINKTSYVENCETSAWGRALGNFGIGIDASVATADEVGNAIANQGKTKTPKAEKLDGNLMMADVKKVIAFVQKEIDHELTDKEIKEVLTWYNPQKRKSYMPNFMNKQSMTKIIEDFQNRENVDGGQEPDDIEI